MPKPLSISAQSAVKELQAAVDAYIAGAKEWHRLESHPGPFVGCRQGECKLANALLANPESVPAILGANKTPPKRLKIVVKEKNMDDVMDDKGEKVFAGAVAGRVFIGTKSELVALTPAGARKLADNLPELASLAESLAASSAAPEIEQINQMAGALVCNGYKWKNGAWYGPTGAAITAHGTPYGQATDLAHAALKQNGGKQHG